MFVKIGSYMLYQPEPADDEEADDWDYLKDRLDGDGEALDEPFHFEEGDISWWTAPKDELGTLLVSFDKVHFYSFYRDFDVLTPEQQEIIKQENSTMYRLKRPL